MALAWYLLAADTIVDLRGRPASADTVDWRDLDVAVAIAFLITEVVEYAMLQGSSKPVEISLRRSSPLTGKLSIASSVLLAPDGDGDEEAAAFQRQEVIGDGGERVAGRDIDTRPGGELDAPLRGSRRDHGRAHDGGRAVDVSVPAAVGW